MCHSLAVPLIDRHGNWGILDVRIFHNFLSVCIIHKHNTFQDGAVIWIWSWGGVKGKCQKLLLSKVLNKIEIKALSTNKKLHLNETPSRFTYNLSINEIYTLILAYILQFIGMKKSQEKENIGNYRKLRIKRKIR